MLAPHRRQILDEAAVLGDGVVQRKFRSHLCFERGNEGLGRLLLRGRARHDTLLARALELAAVLIVAVVDAVDDVPDVRALFQAAALLFVPVVMTLHDSNEVVVFDDFGVTIGQREAFDFFRFGSQIFACFGHGNCLVLIRMTIIT